MSSMWARCSVLLLLPLVSAAPRAAAPVPVPRTVMAWANSNPDAAAQLRNASWSGVFDGAMAYCGISFTPDGTALALNATQFAACGDLQRACKETGAKFYVVLGTVPQGAIDAPEKVVSSAIALAKKLSLDGFSLDDEYDCAPRSTLDRFSSWASFVDAFADGLHGEGMQLTAAVQAMMGIQSVPYKPACQPPQDATCSQACNRAPSTYADEPRVQAIMSNSHIDRWLEMDTYYFGTGRFLGAIDWYSRKVHPAKLGVSMMNRADLTPDGLLARFHAIETSGASWVNIFLLPAADEFRELLLRWKTRCDGCGESTLLGCYDLSAPCNRGGGGSGA